MHEGQKYRLRQIARKADNLDAELRRFEGSFRNDRGFNQELGAGAQALWDGVTAARHTLPRLENLVTAPLSGSGT